MLPRSDLNPILNGLPEVASLPFNLGRRLIRTLSARALLFGVPLLGGATELLSQGGYQPPSAAECVRMREGLISALPPAEDRTWQLILSCGSGSGNALATAVRKLGAVSDTAMLSAALRTIAFFHDASVLEALRLLASDASATTEARATALHIMLLYARPELGLSSMIVAVSRRSEVCFTTAHYGRPAPVVGTPLPDDYRERIRVTADEITRSGGTGAVAAAARCVLSYLPRVIFAPTVDPSSIRLTNTCGNRFLIENLGESRVLLDAVVVGTTHRFKFVLPAGKSRSFRTIETGSVRLDHNGAPLVSKDNEGRPCPDVP